MAEFVQRTYYTEVPSVRSYETTPYSSETGNAISVSTENPDYVLIGKNLSSAVVLFDSSSFLFLNKCSVYDYYFGFYGNSSGGTAISIFSSPFIPDQPPKLKVPSIPIPYFSSADAFYRFAVSSNEFTNGFALDALKNGILIHYSDDLGSAGISTSLLEDYPPKLSVYYTSPYSVQNPTPDDTAVLSNRLDVTFSWRINDSSADEPSYIFRWRRKSTSEEYTADCGKNSMISLSPSIFGDNEIEWCVEGTALDGTPISWNSTWYSLSFTDEDAISSSIARTPNNTVVSKENDLVLRWEHVIATGTSQTRADVETSKNGSDFLALTSIYGSTQSLVIEKHNLIEGDFFWRVKTYNADGISGPWSNVAHIVILGAPDAPRIMLKSITPRPVFTWAAATQVAFELIINNSAGSTIERHRQFGTLYEYQASSCLDDGAYTALLRVQNRFGLWSEWSPAGFTVINNSTVSIDLSVFSNISAVLTWTSNEPCDIYWIYRNGKKIGETTEMLFTDLFALGATSFSVRGFPAKENGNYAVSNTVNTHVSVPSIVIAAVDDQNWLSLDLSTSSLRSVGLSVTHATTYAHYVGARLPLAEIGEFVDSSYQIDCAWPIDQSQKAKRFEVLAGKIVCIKTPSGRCFVGAMGSWRAKENRFFVSYSAPISLVNWEEGAS